MSGCVSKQRAHLVASFRDDLQPSTVLVVALHQRIMPLKGLQESDEHDGTGLLLFTLHSIVLADPSVNNEVFVSLTQRSKESRVLTPSVSAMAAANLGSLLILKQQHKLHCAAVGVHESAW